jgi:amino acid transporter
MNIAPVAEEIHRPQRNIPLALLGGVGIIITLYLGANLAYYLVIPRPEMAELKDTTVATEFSLRLLGPLGAAAASAAVMCSVFGRSTATCWWGRACCTRWARTGWPRAPWGGSTPATAPRPWPSW